METSKCAIACAIAWIGFFLIGARHTFAQSRSALIVHVVDPSGARVANADVSVHRVGESTADRATTDAAGTCGFVRLEPGSYLVTASARLFAAARAERVTIAAGAASEVTLSLALVGFEAQVVVTAENAPEPRERVSKALATVGADDIVTRDLQTVSDAVQLLPAVRNEQLGGPGSQTSIRLNGLRPQDTAVLIDGVPFRDISATQGDATSFVSDLLLVNTDRVEVLRGPGSSLYGSNAIAGAVNVIARPGGETTRGDVAAEGGGLGMGRGNATLGGGIAQQRLTYTVAAAGFHVANGVDGDDRAWNVTGAARVAARVGGATATAMWQTAHAFTMLNNSPAGIAAPSSGVVDAVPLAAAPFAAYQAGVALSRVDFGSSTFIPAADDPDSRRRSQSSIGLIQLTDQATDRFGYSIAYHRVATSREFQNGPLGVAFQPAGTTNSTFDGGIDAVNVSAHSQITSAQRLRVVYELNREEYDSVSTPVTVAARSAASVSERAQAVAVEDETTLGPWQLTLGARGQFFALEAPQFDPENGGPYRGVTFAAPPSALTVDAAAAWYGAATGTKVRAHAGTGYREPSLFERFGTSFGSRGYSVHGDPRLAPERSSGIDVGVEQSIRERAQISIEAFATRLEHLIVFDGSGAIASNDPFGRTIGYRTLGSGRVSGATVASHVSPTGWIRVNAAYTLLTPSSPEGPADPSLAYGLSKHQLTLQTISSLSDRVTVAATALVASSYLAPLTNVVTFATGTFRFSGMKRLDVSGTYRVTPRTRGGVSVFGRIENVTNQTYFESGFLAPGRVANVGVKCAF